MRQLRIEPATTPHAPLGQLLVRHAPHVREAGVHGQQPLRSRRAVVRADEVTQLRRAVRSGLSRVSVDDVHMHNNEPLCRLVSGAGKGVVALGSVRASFLRLLLTLRIPSFISLHLPSAAFECADCAGLYSRAAATQLNSSYRSPSTFLTSLSLSLSLSISWERSAMRGATGERTSARAACLLTATADDTSLSAHGYSATSSHRSLTSTSRCGPPSSATASRTCVPQSGFEGLQDE